MAVAEPRTALARKHETEFAVERSRQKGTARDFPGTCGLLLCSVISANRRFTAVYLENIFT
jgi:hypothetical protein